MLTRQAGQIETVWDELFPEFVRTLPDDLAGLDQVLDAPAVLRRFEQHWGRANLNIGRPSIPMATDCGLAADAVKVLARVARKVHSVIPGLTRKVRDRSRAAGPRIRELNRTLARRTGDAKQEVQRLTEEIAELAKASLGQAKRLLAEAQRAAASGRRRSRRRVAKVVAELEEMIALSGRLVEQIRQRFAGGKIVNRLVSLFDPDARPIRKGKKSNPNQFGYTTQSRS